MKKYKNYIIAAGILVLGIALGVVFSGGNPETDHKEGEHVYTKDSVTQLWTCAMHPHIRSEKPGNCPICGMKLIPVTDDRNGNNEKIGPDEIVLSDEAIQLANIQTTQVVKANDIKEIHLLGRVQPDERKLYSQVSHIPGRIEHLYVNFTGEKVSYGQKIVRIYSPELITAQKELFEAIKSKDIYPQLYTASRNKLKLWKLNDAQVDKIEASGIIMEELDILSDRTGYVMKRNVELGDYVNAGSVLFEIANLSTVWVMFEAYESDIQWIHLNDIFNFTIQALPGKEFEGKVTYVDPFVSSATRVAKVRVEVSNPSTILLPEMYATGIVSAKLRNVKDDLMVPKSAVLWTGKRAVVYVKVPHEKTISFVYREVVLGPDLGSHYIIKEGLMENETVATNGVFRIDASAQLLSMKSMMNPDGGKVVLGGHAGMDMSEGKMDGDMKKEDGDTKDMDHSKMKDKDDNSKTKDDTDHSKMDDRISVPKDFKGQLENVFSKYLSLKDALAGDNAKEAQKQADEVLKAMKNVNMKLLSDIKAHNHWMAISTEMNTSALSISKTNAIAKQRDHFKHLSTHLSKAVTLFGVNKKVYEQFCPMYDNNNGAYWLSLDEKIKNPYLGTEMSTCGETKTIIEK